MTEAGTNEATPVLRPWGYWATFGWALLAFVASTVASVAFLVWQYSGDLSRLGKLHEDGSALALAIIVHAPVQIAMLALAARLARWPVGKYFGLIRPRGRDVAIGIAWFAVLQLVLIGFAYLLGKDSSTQPLEHLIDIYKSARAAGDLVLLWLAIVVIAPLSEEIMFRGFLHRGWVRSRFGGFIAVIVICLLWSATHIQYNWFGLSHVFIIGLWLGFMRRTSGSTTLSFLLHGFNNLYAMIVTTIMVEWFP